MKTELCKKALELVGNPNILVNLISRRVRQLSAGGGSRPLLAETAGMGIADIALAEFVEGKMSWEMVPDPVEPADSHSRKRKRA